MKSIIVLFSLFIMAFTSQSQCNIQANFTYQQIGDSMYFTDASSNTTLITDYFWNFGGSTSSDANPVFNTTSFNGYTSVCLTLIDSSSIPACMSTACDSLFITPDTTCNLNISFYAYENNGSLYVMNTTTGTPVGGGYQWLVNGTLTSSDTDPVFNSAGLPNPVSICLAVNDYQNGTCQDSICNLTYYADSSACNLNITYDYNIIGDSVNFFSTSTGVPNPANYNWTINNNYSSGIDNIWVPLNDSIFNVCLTIWNNNWTCSDTVCQTYDLSDTIINSPCNLQADFSSSTSNNTLYLTSTSLNTNANTTYEWSFNGVVDYNQSPSFNTTGLNGYYLACLTITNPNSNPLCFDEICDSIYIAPDSSNCNVQANFTYTIISDSIIFTNISTNEPLNSEQNWTINGYAYTGNIVQIPSNDSIFYVCLTVGFDFPNWCYDTYCDTINITGDSSACNLNITYDYNIIGDSVNFFSTSTGVPNPANYSWTINNNYSSGIDNIWVPLNDSIFNVCLTIWNADWTCSDTVCQTYDLSDTTSNQCNVQANFTYTIISDSIIFTNTSINEPANSEQNWTINGYAYTGNTVQIPSNDSIFYVCLTVGFDFPNWCYDTYCDTINITNDSSLTINQNTFGNLNIYPNPFSTSIFVKTSSYDNSKLIIYNYLGEMLLEQNITSTLTEVNTDQLPNGLYLIKLIDRNTNNYVIKKIVKQ